MTRLWTLNKEEVIEVIMAERVHQLNKFGHDKEQSLPGFLLIIESELEEAKRAWIKGGEGRHSAMAEVVQIAATAFAAIETYGASGCPESTNDKVVEGG